MMRGTFAMMSPSGIASSAWRTIFDDSAISRQRT
jgi:hypothetical protein